MKRLLSLFVSGLGSLLSLTAASALILAHPGESFSPVAVQHIAVRSRYPSASFALRKYPQQVKGCNRSMQFELTTDSMFEGRGDKRASSNKTNILSKFSLLAPLWTTLAALYAVLNPASSGIFGSLNIIHNALMTLMFAMGLAITPNDISKVLSNPKLILLNALLCYGMVPLLALLISKAFFLLDPLQTSVGLLLLASVSGGQASNLFTMIAGGDVALSVICTLSTTLLGVVATPALAKLLLGQTVVVDFKGVVKSVASLVLVPLLSGIGVGQFLPPKMMKRISPGLPTLGVLATIILVMGGASNIPLTNQYSLTSVALPSCVLCLASGAVAWWITTIALPKKEEEATKRALVIETLSKSPTLAYVLACRHFGPSAAAVPAAAMVTLAILGAIVASLWSALAPIDAVKE